MQTRIERTVAAIRDTQNDLLDPKTLMLFNYSQGTDQAETLAARWNDKYRLVILDEPSREPRLRHLNGTATIAMFGNELKTTGHMHAGTELLAATGKPVHFFLLPATKHDEYDPESNHVIGEILSWIMTPHNDETTPAPAL